MWKITTRFKFKSNMKKHDIVFSLTPVIAFLTDKDSIAESSQITLMWFFFQYDITFKYETDDN